MQDTTARLDIPRRPGLQGTLAFLGLLPLTLAVYARICHPSFLGAQLREVVVASPVLGYALFLLLGSLRGFTLIPSTYLVAVGLLLFPPWPLFLLVMGGILVSSALASSSRAAGGRSRRRTPCRESGARPQAHHG